MKCIDYHIIYNPYIQRKRVCRNKILYRVQIISLSFYICRKNLSLCICNAKAMSISICDAINKYHIYNKVYKRIRNAYTQNFRILKRTSVGAIPCGCPEYGLLFGHPQGCPNGFLDANE